MKHNKWTLTLALSLLVVGAALTTGPAQAEDMILTAGEYSVLVASDDYEIVSMWIDDDGYFHVNVVASVSTSRSTKGAAIRPDG